MSIDFSKIKTFINTELIHIKDLSITLSDVAIMVLVYVIGLLSLRFFKKLMHRAQEKEGFDISRVYALYKTFKYLLGFIFILFCLDTIGLNLNVVLAGSAALLVGVGLGLQRLYLDFFSGIILLFDGTIKVGDIIEVNGIVGRVDQIDFRTSKITTPANIDIVIPNSRLTDDHVTNWTRNKTASRFGIAVSVAYGTDLKLVEKILIECLEDINKVSKRQSPKVQLVNFGDNGIELHLLFWTHEMFRIEILKSEIRFKVEEVFKQNNVVIPFPQRDLHFITNKNKPSPPLP